MSRGSSKPHLSNLENTWRHARQIVLVTRQKFSFCSIGKARIFFWLVCTCSVRELCKENNKNSFSKKTSDPTTSSSDKCFHQIFSTEHNIDLTCTCVKSLMLIVLVAATFAWLQIWENLNWIFAILRWFTRRISWSR